MSNRRVWQFNKKTGDHMRFVWNGKVYRAGLMVRLASFWMGAHWSPVNKRWCINVVPCVTIWFVLPGGNVPIKSEK